MHPGIKVGKQKWREAEFSLIPGRKITTGKRYRDDGRSSTKAQDREVPTEYHTPGDKRDCGIEDVGD